MSEPEKAGADSAPFEPTLARLVETMGRDMVVLSIPRLHREPQLFVRVRTRKAGWCRVTCVPISKGHEAFAPLRRTIAYCYICPRAIEAARAAGAAGRFKRILAVAPAV